MTTTAPAGAASATHHALRDLGRQRKLGVLRCPHVRHDPAAAPPPRARPPRRRTLSNAPSTEYTNAAFMSRASCTRGARQGPRPRDAAHTSARTRTCMRPLSPTTKNEYVSPAACTRTSARQDRARGRCATHTGGARTLSFFTWARMDRATKEFTPAGAPQGLLDSPTVRARKRASSMQRPPLPHPTPAAGHP